MFGAVVPPAAAHSGRTDASGCHTCRTNCAKHGLRNGQYHCHGSSRTSAVRRAKPPAPPPPVQLLESELPTRELPENSIVIRPSQPPNRGDGVRVEVLAIVDGDTFVAREGEEVYLLKLRDLEAPEPRQSHGSLARQRLEELIAGRWILVWPTQGKGCMIPVQAETLEGMDISKKLLSEGLAWARPSSPEELRRLETAARLGRVGLWRDTNPESPWEYRARRTMPRQQKRP